MNTRCLITPMFYFCLMLMALVDAGTATAQETFDYNVDFGDSTKKINYNPGQAKGKITGLMPEAWTENSNWADVDIQYIPARSEGLKYLKMRVTRLQSGLAQINIPIPSPKKKNTYELSLKVRNQTRGPVDFSIRQRGAPYQHLWQSPKINYGEWQTHKFRFQLESTEDSIALFLFVRNIGDMDIANIRIRSIDLEQMKRDILKQYPKHGPANLIRHTRVIGALPAG